MLLKPLTFHSPQTLSEAAQLYANLENVKILAGGTFLLNTLKLLKRKGIKTPQNVISLRKVEELKGVSLVDDKLIIKAMTTISDLFDSPLLTDNLTVLKTVCRNISTTPIRNMATVGGNLTCRYTWTEMGAVMVALGADMHFIGSAGTEQVITAEEFFAHAAKTDKILFHVAIQKNPSAVTSYYRVKKTLNVDVPLLAVCIKTIFKENRFTNTRVGINNGTNFVKRDAVLEEFLNGTTCDDKTSQEALEHLDTSLYDHRSDDYKKYMFRVGIKKTIEELIGKREKTQ